MSCRRSVVLSLALSAFLTPIPRFVAAADLAPHPALPATAAATDIRRSSFSVRRWTTEDGLPQNRVNCLAQTPDGYLWCGTLVGLVRFDGRRFVVFDRRNTPELAESETIYSLAADRQGRLWIGTAKGLIRFDQGRFEAISPVGGWKGSSVESLFPSGTGGMWVASPLGLFHVAESLADRVLNPPLAPDFDGTSTVIETDAGALFRSESYRSSLALEVRPDSTSHWQQVSVSTVRASGNNQARLAGRDATGIWAVIREGLIHVSNGGALRRESLPADLESTGILNSLRNNEGTHWFVDRSGGLWCRMEGQTERVRTAPAFRYTDAACLFEDAERNLWICANEGLCRLRPQIIETITARDGLPDDETWSVCTGQSGRIWVATRMGIAGIFEGRVARLPPPPTEFSEGFHCVLEDAAGTLYAAPHDGNSVLVWGTDGWTNWHGAERNTAALYQDRRGRLWSAGSDGASCWDGSAWKRWSRKNGFPIDHVRVVHQSQDGAMWFGERLGGLVWLDESTGRCRALGRTNGLACDEIWCIEETPDGALWLGSNTGLHRVSPDVGTRLRAEVDDPADSLGMNRPKGAMSSRVFAFTPAHGLPADSVNWILPDDAGHFWLSGLRGIHRVSWSDLEGVARGDKSRVACATYGVEDGMLTAETNGEHQPAGCKSPDGRLWFPTARGLVVLDPRQASRIDLPPRVVLEEVLIDGENLNDGARDVTSGTSPASDTPRAGLHGRSWRPGSMASSSPLQLQLAPGRARVVRFGYTAPTYLHPEKVRFRHRLHGLDDAWHDAGTERVAYFTNLKPGGYRFEVLAVNAEGLWSQQPAQFAFTLVPSFAQTVWFPVSLTLGGVLLAGTFGAWRLRWQRRLLRLNQLRDLERERSRIARDMHDDLGSRLARVSLLSDLAAQPTGLPRQTVENVAKIAATARETMVAMEELVWAVDPSQDSLTGLVQFLARWIEEFCQTAGLRCRIDIATSIPSVAVASTHRQACLLAVKEILRNVTQHAHAQEVRLRVKTEESWLHLEISDDGRGISSTPPDNPASTGHRGLRNIAQRMREAGGEMELLQPESGGTTVRLRLPLKLF